MPCFLAPVCVRTVRMRRARSSHTPPAANPMPHKGPHCINNAEPNIVRQGGQKLRYYRLWKRSPERFGGALPGDFARISDVLKRARLYRVPIEIEAKGETIKNRKTAHEEYVYAAFQLVRQFLIATPCPTHFTRVVEQHLEFVPALRTSAVTVTYRLP